MIGDGHVVCRSQAGKGYKYEFIYKQIERNILAQSVMHPQSHQRLHSTTYWHVHLSKLTAVFVGT